VIFSDGARGNYRGPVVSAVGKNVLDVAAPIKDANNLSDVATDSVKDDVRTDEHRSKPGSDFVARAANKRMLF